MSRYKVQSPKYPVPRTLLSVPCSLYLAYPSTFALALAVPRTAPATHPPTWVQGAARAAHERSQRSLGNTVVLIRFRRHDGHDRTLTTVGSSVRTRPIADIDALCRSTQSSATIYSYQNSVKLTRWRHHSRLACQSTLEKDSTRTMMASFLLALAWTRRSHLASRYHRQRSVWRSWIERSIDSPA